VIQPEFFGMHILSLGMHRVWPATPFGVYRTWDGVYRWHNARPAPGEWFPFALDQLEHFRTEMESLVPEGGAMPKLMFTLAGGGENGGFPTWIDPFRDDRVAIHAEWREYVRTLGQRFSGFITYWEIWNEIDCPCFYEGPIDLLVELTNIAAEELRAASPDNVILSAVNTEPGSERFEEFLRLGGAREVDIATFHLATPAAPETGLEFIRNVRDMYARHGAGHLPLWATEGHTASVANASPEEDAGRMARDYLVLLTQGVENYSWYGWDIWDYGTYQGITEWVRLTEHGRPDVATAAGVAYRELYHWLVGARVDSLAVNGKAWRLHLSRGQARSTIYWLSSGPEQIVTLEKGVRTLRFLDGRSGTPPSDRRQIISTIPVLAEH
jgi:hypothetical protein